ncbi:MAG: ImmA/IrrE family metallo-endopeptidase [Gammaproteobacteria bacterium]|nr:ImmA/IrrE family metallo-endopeptidase [Gammaproteobacteria bacterium]
MEKIAINPSRLEWCLNAVQIDIECLSVELKIAQKTLEQAMESKEVFSVNQLEKIANYFKRNLLFFLESEEPQEDKIYSPQFRTINNQKPIHSPKLRGFVEQVEKQRQVYLGLLEDLDETINNDWYPDDLNLNEDIKDISANIRRWLELAVSDDFSAIRDAVEQKGIMVIVSNGYNGKWQIDKKNPVRGFSLYYEILPIIVIKKQTSLGAQTFTLMHELAHLLLHRESAIDNGEDFCNYQGKEKEANEFAGNLLIPDGFLTQIDIEQVLKLQAQEYNSFFEKYRKLWSVSNTAILVRLLINEKISQEHYQNYVNYQEEQLKREANQVGSGSIPRIYRHREPMNIFGKPFVYTVFDSLHNKKITLAKASTYLDNLKISDVRQLEQYV